MPYVLPLHIFVAIPFALPDAAAVRRFLLRRGLILAVRCALSLTTGPAFGMTIGS